MHRTLYIQLYDNAKMTRSYQNIKFLVVHILFWVLLFAIVSLPISTISNCFALSVNYPSYVYHVNVQFIPCNEFYKVFIHLTREFLSSSNLMANGTMRVMKSRVIPLFCIMSPSIITYKRTTHLRALQMRRDSNFFFTVEVCSVSKRVFRNGNTMHPLVSNHCYYFTNDIGIAAPSSYVYNSVYCLTEWLAIT